MKNMATKYLPIYTNPADEQQHLKAAPVVKPGGDQSIWRKPMVIACKPDRTQPHQHINPEVQASQMHGCTLHLSSVPSGARLLGDVIHL